MAIYEFVRVVQCHDSIEGEYYLVNFGLEWPLLEDQEHALYNAAECHHGKIYNAGSLSYEQIFCTISFQSIK